MSFSIIAAVEGNNGIGKDNKIPWYITEDFKYFAKITKATQNPEKQNAVIMGTNTWHSLPNDYRPLPGRLNVVLNSENNLKLSENEGLVYSSLDEALQYLDNNDDVENVFIIGGAMLYKFAIENPACDKLYITQIKNKFDCDTYFPEIPDKFKLSELSDIKQDKDLEFQFLVYNLNK